MLLGAEPISVIPEESKPTNDKEDVLQSMVIEPNENEIKTQSTVIKLKDVAESK